MNTRMGDQRGITCYSYYLTSHDMLVPGGNPSKTEEPFGRRN